jgi:hypothetical protein
VYSQGGGRSHVHLKLRLLFRLRACHEKYVHPPAPTLKPHKKRFHSVSLLLHKCLRIFESNCHAPKQIHQETMRHIHLQIRIHLHTETSDFPFCTLLGCSWDSSPRPSECEGPFYAEHHTETPCTPLPQALPLTLRQSRRPPHLPPPHSPFR